VNFVPGNRQPAGCQGIIIFENYEILPVVIFITVFGNEFNDWLQFQPRLGNAHGQHAGIGAGLCRQ
jgi:hypothetical protein